MTDLPHNARRLCARVIARWLTTRDFPDRMLPAGPTERALIQEIVYGVSRWKRLLEWIMNTLVSREPDPDAKAYLLVGLYQLFLMDAIPPHAAVNETVEAAKSDLDPARIRFVNGVLRSALRKIDAIRSQIDAQPMAIRTSHPDVLTTRWTNQYGKAATEAICTWNNQRPSVVLRVNTFRTTMEAYAAQLTEAGINAQPHPADPEHFLILPPGVSIRELPGYAQGHFTIQDPATLLAVNLLDLRPGLKLLDACAAPGGKTFACAEQMQNDGLVLAVDRHADRLAQLKENSTRMGFACVSITQADATTRAGLGNVAAQRGPFDRILLDVPCSNTGVLRRRPDARWRFSEKRLSKLVGVQARMLNACSKLLAPGGALVYSTCSLEAEENEKQIERWIAQNRDFRIDAKAISIPPDSDMDGAYAVRLVRN
jgi:16S rRNA (cytosine967-C5)-methyltransferase